MAARSEIIVRPYTSNDFNDLISSGYVFDLSAFCSGHLFRDFKMKMLNMLGRVKEEHLVAFHTVQSKAVGFVTLRKITDTLYGIWNTFVHPNFRGRGIAKLLYDSSFEYLSDKGVKKAIGTVAITNIPSIKSIRKVWDGFLSQKFYYIPYENVKLSFLHSHNECKLRTIPFSYARRIISTLFKIYKECVNEDWISFLEIDESNFLERFIDYPKFSKGMLSILFSKCLLYGESKGYAVLIYPKTRGSAIVHLFIPRNLTDDDAMLLLRGVIRELKSRKRKGLVKCLAGNELQIERIFSKINVKAIPHLVCFKKLQ
ncbi:MAG: GNAT family N-acetyltransferase [Promethearchaeota archaeon]